MKTLFAERGAQFSEKVHEKQLPTGMFSENSSLHTNEHVTDQIQPPPDTSVSATKHFEYLSDQPH